MKTRVDPVLGDRAQTWEKIIATSGSKLSKTDYPLVDPMFNVFFQKQKQKDIDPIFAGRLAAFARKNDISIFVGSGYRSYEEQVRCYEESGGKQDKNGNWVGGDGSAAVPGRSWHNNGEAIDISWLGEPSSKYIREDLYGHSASTEEQVKLIEYGIFKPLTSGNGITKKSQLENWHIQPIETRGISDTAKRRTFYDAYKTIKPVTAPQAPVVPNVNPQKEKTNVKDNVPSNGDKWDVVQNAMRGVKGDENIILAQSCLFAMGFPIGDYGINKNGVDGKYGRTCKFWIIEFQSKKGLPIDGVLNSKTLEELKKAVLAGETMKSLGIVAGTNPSKKEVIEYITKKCTELGIPVNLGLATAWQESGMRHFNENGASGPNASNDWGLMQINRKDREEVFEQAFDNDPNTPDIVHNWQDNVDYGLNYIKQQYKRAVDLGEANKGPYDPEHNIAFATYSLYNSGSKNYRYRTTRTEAAAQGLATGCYSSLVDGYDSRDVSFREVYLNKPWE